MLLSVVAPLYNEESAVEELVREIHSAARAVTEDYEVLLVDDGSTDATLERALRMRQAEPRLKVLSLSRNFGHQAAYTAGLTYATGEYVAMLDGDLQDPPELIPRMLETLRAGDLDLVYAQRSDTHESFVRTLALRVFHRVFHRVSSVRAPANVGNFCLMNRSALEALLSLKEKSRYLPGLRHFIGFRHGFVDYSRPARRIGTAKMGTRRLVGLALDAIFSFSDIPIKICIVLGMTGIVFSLLGAAVVLVKKVIGDAIIGWTSILLSVYFLGSVQLLFLGIMGEYIFRIFAESQDRPVYIVRRFYE
jgi:dolichol-phosphate mannosyltransferase